MGKPQRKIQYRTPPEFQQHGKITSGQSSVRDRLQAEMMEIQKQNRRGVPPQDATHPNQLRGRELADIRYGNYNPIIHPRTAPGMNSNKIYMKPNHYEREHSRNGVMRVPRQYLR
jgi:hypothetical protein